MPRTTGVTGAQEHRTRVELEALAKREKFFRVVVHLMTLILDCLAIPQCSEIGALKYKYVPGCARAKAQRRGTGARADQQWCACAGATQFARDGIASDHPWLGRGRQRCRATGACCKPRREPRGGRARGGVHAAGERGGRPVHARAAQPGAVDDAKLLHQPSPVLGRGGDSTRELRGRRRCVSTARRCGRTGE